VLRRQVRRPIRLTNNDRLFFVQLYRWFPSVLNVITVIRPETIVRWHRTGFRCYWRWKSRALGGRPQIEADLRVLIRRMSVENPLWGAPRIHGELCLSLALRSPRRRWPNSWSSGMARQVRDGAPSCATTRRISLPWICSLSRPFKPIAPASPWQNGFAERLIGSIRRECVDHFVVWGETHLRRGSCDLRSRTFQIGTRFIALKEAAQAQL
jgi:hypothetical protein